MCSGEAKVTTEENVVTVQIPERMRSCVVELRRDDNPGNSDERAAKQTPVRPYLDPSGATVDRSVRRTG